MEELAAKVVFVTGAAGNLGGAVARAFRDAGARLALLDHRQGRLAGRFEGGSSAPVPLFVEGVDLAHADAVADAIARVHTHFGRIDAVVNAAGGYQASGLMEDVLLSQWDQLMDLNARSVLNVCRAVLPLMKAQRSGKIVNFASGAALAGSAQHAAYSASKSAVLRLTESVADEVRGMGVNVNCVLPSTLDTPANRQAVPEGNRQGWVALDALVDVVAFLCSERARAIHGAAIAVYGRD